MRLSPITNRGSSRFLPYSVGIRLAPVCGMDDRVLFEVHHFTWLMVNVRSYPSG